MARWAYSEVESSADPGRSLVVPGAVPEARSRRGLVRGTVIDVAWIGQPGQLLAGEV
jgi:hypothetical protein